MGKAFKYQGYYTAYFRSQLADKLQSLGYDIERTKHGFEVKGVDRETIEQFSRRTKKIEELAKKHDITDPEQKAKLGKLSREAKTNRFNKNELQELWTQTVGDEKATQLRAITEEAKQRGARQNAEQQNQTLKESYDYAINNFLERYSVADAFKLKTLALQRGIGGVTLDRLNNHIETLAQTGQVITAKLSGADIITTRKAIQDEKDIVAFVNDSTLSKSSSLIPKSKQTIESTYLTEHQQKAVRHVWESQDKVVGI